MGEFLNMGSFRLVGITTETTYQFLFISSV